jgi:hypothetical protein
LEEELSGLAAIEADSKLTPEAKTLAATSSTYDTPEIIKTLQDGNGVVTFQSLVDRLKTDAPGAKDSDLQQATVAWWVF